MGRWGAATPGGARRPRRPMLAFRSTTRTSGPSPGRSRLAVLLLCFRAGPHRCAAKGDQDEVEKVRATPTQGHPRRPAQEGRAAARPARGRDQARAGGDVEEATLVVDAHQHDLAYGYGGGG